MSTAPNARARRVRRLAASITLAAVLVGADSAVVAGRAAGAGRRAVPRRRGRDRTEVRVVRGAGAGPPAGADPRRRRREVRSGRTLRLGDPGVGEGVPGVQGTSGDGCRRPGDRAGARSGQRSRAEPRASSSGGTLARGAVGDRVRQLQRSLINAGIPVPGGADGVFGPGTESAVKAYQRSRGLVATGRADAATLSALNRGAPAIGPGGLARGATGSAVRSLQQALVNAGIPVAGGVGRGLRAGDGGRGEVLPALPRPPGHGARRRGDPERARPRGPGVVIPDPRRSLLQRARPRRAWRRRPAPSARADAGRHLRSRRRGRHLRAGDRDAR